MKFLSYPLIAVLLLCGCAKKNDVTPDLASAIDDKELAEILPGKWTFSLLGKGSKYWTETISFNKESPRMSSATAVNEYETLSSPTFNTASYKIRIKNGIMEAETESGDVKKVFRIEKNSPKSITLYERLNLLNPKSELAGKEYNKGR